MDKTFRQPPPGNPPLPRSLLSRQPPSLPAYWVLSRPLLSRQPPLPPTAASLPARFFPPAIPFPPCGCSFVDTCSFVFFFLTLLLYLGLERCSSPSHGFMGKTLAEGGSVAGRKEGERGGSCGRGGGCRSGGQRRCEQFSDIVELVVMGAGEDAAVEAAHDANAGGGHVVEVPPGWRRWLGWPDPEWRQRSPWRRHWDRMGGG